MKVPDLEKQFQIQTQNVEYSSHKKQKILIVLIILLLVCLVIKHLIQYGLNYLRERKLNISFVFITQIYFSVPKNIKLNSTLLHYKNLNKRELQHVAFSHSSDIDSGDFTNLYKNCAAKPYFS